MNATTSEPSPQRPVLFGAVSPVRSIQLPRGGKPKVNFNNSSARVARLDDGFENAFSDFQEQVALSTSIQAADPQLVLVFEAIDERTDLSGVAQRLGFEVLNESEGSMDPTEDFTLISEAPKDLKITTCLHAVCLSEFAMSRLLQLWRTWKRTGRVPHGYGKLKDLFGHLKDVHTWGPEDRLKTMNWEEYFAGRIPGQLHTIEIELWYRQSSSLRQKAQIEVEKLITDANGTLLTSSTIAAVGYHAVKCQVGDDIVSRLAQGQFEHVKVVRSSNVMYLRLAGQSVPLSSPGVEAPETSEPLPAGAPVVCLLDGVPAANHHLLADRVYIHDPDDLSADSASTLEDRKHGTWMASAIIWGDRSKPGPALSRPILARPILTPASDTQGRIEEIRADELTPDLMERIFFELFEGTEEEPPVAPEVVIVNLSVGDPTTPFDSVLSSWARTLDWLSYRYGVLIVVSAGNYPSLPAHANDSSSIQQLTGLARREAILASQQADQANRRLLSPGEAINALTVGAIHDDSSEGQPLGYRFDPSDGLPSVSPVTALGGGYRRSMKPELAAPGGKVHFKAPPMAVGTLSIANASTTGPGIKVATSSAGQEAFTSGTSPAAALVTRGAARIHDVLDEITEGVTLTRHQRSVAIKALLAHGARHPDGLHSESLALRSAIGFGSVERDYSLGCSSNEAVILYLGTLGAAEEQELLLPLPNGLNVRETKRISATLGWLSPINWRHRQYRKAALNFTKPKGGPVLSTPVDLSDDDAKRGSGTVKHLLWETEKAFGTGHGSNISLRVKCVEQAGGLDGERIPYAVALSLWVSPTINVDVYAEVRDQIQPSIAVRPRL
ncbi:S8 family peptidase [Arthrobacter sp. JSM 101049]|uniref:S8 family peptidase n=1 Tax=Arthrobacter sp. JSM 101049 TaxID=929097 RepID=UPI0035692FF2